MSEIAEKLMRIMKNNLIANLPEEMIFTIDPAPAVGYDAEKWRVAVWDSGTMVRIRQCYVFIDDIAIFVQPHNLDKIAAHYFNPVDNEKWKGMSTPIHVINAGIDYLYERGDYAHS